MEFSCVSLTSVVFSSSVLLRGLCGECHELNLRRHHHRRRESSEKTISTSPVRIKANRAVSGPAHQPVQLSIRLLATVAAKSTLLEEPACPETPQPAPLPNQGCCGPDGIRTRTFELDRLMCCHYTAGPSAAYESEEEATRSLITSVDESFQILNGRRQFLSVFPVFSVY
jgi:hypothetical protein